MSVDKSKLGIDLNAPAFGTSAPKAEIPMSPSVEETEAGTEPKVKEEEAKIREENKVPYSRFKNIHSRALEAEAEAEKWRERAEELEANRRESRISRETEETSEMPPEWKELYGDSELSERAWKLQERREREIERKAYEAAERAAEEREIRQQARINENLSVIDENFEDLSAYVGRELTDKEQAAVLDIVDDFTPKDDYGRYAGPLIPFDKAWEMYELKQGSSTSSQRKDRDEVAAISGTSSQGNTDTALREEQDKNWTPKRGSWRKYFNA